jgi:hypothetical protein
MTVYASIVISLCFKNKFNENCNNWLVIILHLYIFFYLNVFRFFFKFSDWLFLNSKNYF